MRLTLRPRRALTGKRLLCCEGAGLSLAWAANGPRCCSALLCRGKGREGRGLGDASGAEPSPQVSAEVTVGAWCLCGGKMATVAAPGSEEGKQL